MPLKESEAIILRTYPLGEGDRLVSFLDRQAGRLRGVARGASRPRSRFGSTLELLSHIRIWYFERETRELVRINQCELLESFLDAQQDYRAAVVLGLMSEITEAVLGEREPAEAQFRLLLLAARAIKHQRSLSIALAYFAVWTLRLGGWLAPPDRCSRCGRPFGDSEAYGSPGSTGLACRDCRQTWMREISPDALRIWRSILSLPLERVVDEKPQPAVTDEISSYALDVIEHHIDRKLATRKALITRGEVTF